MLFFSSSELSTYHKCYQISYPDMVDRRVQLRQELLQQNFLNVVQALRVENDPDLNVQLDTFVKKMEDDNRAVELDSVNMTGCNL